MLLKRCASFRIIFFYFAQFVRLVLIVFTVPDLEKNAQCGSHFLHKMHSRTSYLCVDKWDTDPVVAVQLAQVIAVRHHLLVQNTNTDVICIHMHKLYMNKLYTNNQCTHVTW